jgi:zinc finger protein
VNELKNQLCPMCGKKKMTLTEESLEVPYFGKIHVFAMRCDECKYYKSDIEAEEAKEPAKYTLEINSADDLKIRVVKSAEATVKVPHVTTIEPGTASVGYITNVEGIFRRIKRAVETARDMEEDADSKKKAKKLLKKIQKILWGQEKAKLIIEDPTGNSAIISERAVKSKLK